MITNINNGICQSRIQQGKPALFVNWMEDEKQNHKFFEYPFQLYQFEDKLKIRQQNELNTSSK